MTLRGSQSRCFLPSLDLSIRLVVLELLFVGGRGVITRSFNVILVDEFSETERLRLIWQTYPLQPAYGGRKGILFSWIVDHRR